MHSQYKFCLLTIVGRDLSVPAAEFAFFVHDPNDLLRADARYTLTPEEITLLNPNSGTCPSFRTRRDAEITLGIHRRVPVLIREGDSGGNPWGIKFMQGLFNMTSDSNLFHTRGELENDGWQLNGNVFERGSKQMLPLYEGKMIHHFDWQWATFELDGSWREPADTEKADPAFEVLPRYWVAKSEVDTKLPTRLHDRMLAGYRWISNVMNERTLIASSFPYSAVGNSLPVIITEHDSILVTTTLSTFVVDYCTRQKLGGRNVTFGTVSQLPIVPPVVLEQRQPWQGSRLDSWILQRVDEIYRAESASVLRLRARAEIDAAFFHLYGIEREDVDYIMETFPIVKRKDIATHGEYRTKGLILEIYDAMAEAEATSVPYASPFDDAGK